MNNIVLLSVFFSFISLISFPVNSFAQQYETGVPSAANLPPQSANSQMGFLIVYTNIVNDNGGTKKPSDFTISVSGNQPAPLSFQAIPSPKVQIVSIQPGQYSFSVNNIQGYELSFKNQCNGQINSKEIKSCVITVDDILPPSQLPTLPQSLPGLLMPQNLLPKQHNEEDTTIAQIPSTIDHSKIGFLVLSTYVINDNGGTKKPSDFMINVAGSPSFPSSFQAVQHAIQVVVIQEGQYSISVKNIHGYEWLLKNQCSGQINAGDIKTCLIIIDDLSTEPPQCPPGQHFDQGQQKCIPDLPPSDGSYPVQNILWFYDSKPALSEDITIPAGNTHQNDKVLLSSGASGVNSHSIKNGWLEIESGGGNGRVYWNYHELPEFSQSSTAGFNTVMTGTFMFKPGIDNLSIKDGNHGTDGWVLDGQYEFGGLGLSIHRTEVQSKVEYWHNRQGSEISSPYPNGINLQNDKEYKFFVTFRTDRVNQEVLLNVWLDFNNGQGWVQVLKDRKWGQDGWSPGSVPSGKDSQQILDGPSFIKKHHIWTRANGVGSMPIKDIKIGTIDFLS